MILTLPEVSPLDIDDIRRAARGDTRASAWSRAPEVIAQEQRMLILCDALLSYRSPAPPAVGLSIRLDRLPFCERIRGEGEFLSCSWAHHRPEVLMMTLNSFDYRAARIAAGVTLSEAGDAVGVTESMMSKVESGDRRLSPEQSTRLREFLVAALRRKAEQTRSLIATLSAA